MYVSIHHFLFYTSLSQLPDWAARTAQPSPWRSSTHQFAVVRTDGRQDGPAVGAGWPGLGWSAGGAASLAESWDENDSRLESGWRFSIFWLVVIFLFDFCWLSITPQYDRIGSPMEKIQQHTSWVFMARPWGVNVHLHCWMFGPVAVWFSCCCLAGIPSTAILGVACSHQHRRLVKMGRWNWNAMRNAGWIWSYELLMETFSRFPSYFHQRFLALWLDIYQFFILESSIPAGWNLHSFHKMPRYSALEPDWRMLPSASSASLCAQMLSWDLKSRPSAAECLRHSWLSAEDSHDVAVPMEALGNLLPLGSNMIETFETFKGAITMWRFSGAYFTWGGSLEATTSKRVSY